MRLHFLKKIKYLQHMRVVSLVPSWTETLIECSVNIVGRTRFCIHPESSRLVPAVGGTKDWNFSKLKDLKPDLLVLDQEENPLFMAEQKEIPFWASHITSIQDLPSQVKKLAQLLENNKLSTISERWATILHESRQFPWGQLPGITQWLRPIEMPISRVYYLIWRDPWMHVSENTFIGSMLGHLTQSPLLVSGSVKYPTVELSELKRLGTLLLFSSEPYPFARKAQIEQLLREFENPMAIIDGEAFSWFGIRSLEFLERL